MRNNIKEYQFYENFNQITIDILHLAKEIIPEGFLFLSAFTNKEQQILKITENKENIHIFMREVQFLSIQLYVPGLTSMKERH